MQCFSIRLEKFEDKGEKTNWTYIEVSSNIASLLNPNHKQSFRVKGKIDELPVKSLALLPMGDGNFIIPINQTLRRKLGKEEGQVVEVAIELDTEEKAISQDLLDCLENEPEAQDFFLQLAKSHQRYFSNWIESAKTDKTKEDRILKALTGLRLKMDYGQMIRHFKNKGD